MTIPRLLSIVMVSGCVVVIAASLAWAGYKVAPMVWKEVNSIRTRAAAPAHTPSVTTAQSPPATAITNFTSNSNVVATRKTPERDLGVVSLTNHYQTCVRLGGGKDCLLTPKMIDGHNIQLTVEVESKTATGKMHDLFITQVITPSGKPFEVAVGGGLWLSLTPNVSME